MLNFMHSDSLVGGFLQYLILKSQTTTSILHGIPHCLRMICLYPFHPGGKGPQTTGGGGIAGSLQCVDPQSRATDLGSRSRSTTGGLLQSGGLQSRATDFGSGRPRACALHRLGASSLGAYSLARPILNLTDHVLVLYIDCGPRVWGPTVSRNLFWIWPSTYPCFT